VAGQGVLQIANDSPPPHTLMIRFFYSD
jgi:hypothetical protein